MRQYLLTGQERQIIQKYLETGEKLEGFKVLLYRCRNMKTIEEDQKLIQQFLRKTENKAKRGGKE